MYFSYHPEEQSLFLDNIARELLALYNCAVWYDPQPGTEIDWEEWKLDLQEMQLFVMPVTGQLLSRPSDAMDRELPFALENHIPVLPLLEEQGLEQLFNEKFQDIQFLNLHCQDSTAQPYKDKLKKYLDSVLIGDELAAQVRAAFDAYIFLSYRKKDRRAAQQLMRMVVLGSSPSLSLANWMVREAFWLLSIPQYTGNVGGIYQHATENRDDISAFP